MATSFWAIISASRYSIQCLWANFSLACACSPWIDKPPSAELRPDQKDQDTLPPYDVLDAILELYIEQQLSADEIVAHGHDVLEEELACLRLTF